MCCLVFLFDDVETEVGTQAFGHNDAFGSLVVLQKGGHYSWQGEGTAVEGVGQFHLAVGVFETQFHAVCLECLEIGYRTDLEPFLLCGAPYLEIEGHGRCETDIATAEFENMVGQTQFVEQASNMFLHLFQLLV